MVEKIQLLSQMISHETLITDRIKKAIPSRDGSWFDTYGRYFDPTRLIYALGIDVDMPEMMPDLQATRAVAAHFLGLASQQSVFFQEHRFDDPQPTENDRLSYCDYIEFQLSITGLLNLQEIQQIRERGWWDQEITSMPRELLFQKNVDLPSFSEVSNKITDWKNEGWKIALFHGAFDPPTITHLQNLTTVYSYSSVTGVPLKIIVGFDSDKLIKRKGEDRPRYPLDKRREQIARFWMVDETVVLRVNRPLTNEFVHDYIDLGVDYIVTTIDPNDIATRLDAITKSDLEVIPIPVSPLPTSTQILDMASSRREKRL